MANKAKMPTAVQLPSGNWRCRFKLEGEDNRRSITASTKDEAEYQARAIILGHAALPVKEKQEPVRTLADAMAEYIELRVPLKSVSTIRGYRIIERSHFQSLMQSDVKALDDKTIQLAVNKELKEYSVKTMKNACGLLGSVIAEETGRHIKIILPQMVQDEKRFLQPEQLQPFYDAIKGTKHELLLLLCLHGLRASEAMNIQGKDLDLKRGIIHVRGAAVLDEANCLIHQEANKNTTSRRDVPFIIERALKLAKEVDLEPDEYLFKGSGTGILHHAVTRACEKAGLPQIGVHDLRRTFASICYNAGISEAVCMKLGGWSDIYTMRKIYCQVSDDAFDSSVELLKASFKNRNSPDSGHESGHDVLKMA